MSFVPLATGIGRAADGDAPERTVTVAFNSALSDASAAARAIEAHLSGLKVAVTMQARAGLSWSDWLSQSAHREEPPSSIGQFYVDTGAGGELLVFFSEPGAASNLIRRIRAQRQPVALEEAGIVVRSVVEALLEGGRVGVSVPAQRSPPAISPAPLPPSIPPVAEQSEARGGPAAAILVRYSGTWLASERGLESGIAIGLRAYPWRALKSLSVGAAYGVFAPALIDLPSAQIALQRHPLEVGLSYVGGEPLGWLAELTFVADYVARTTIQTGTNLERTEPSGRWLFGSSARAGACYAGGRALRWCLLGGLDLYASKFSYSVIEASGPASFSLSRVRPRVDAGFTFDFL